MPGIFVKPKRTAGNAWLESINPINGLSIREAKTIFDQARLYGSPRLQKIYDEIELTDPVLMTCVERRTSALSGLGWKIVARSSADKSLANDQRDEIDSFLSGIENFAAALEHLSLAFFRGFSHVQPIWEDDLHVKRIQLLDNWNFLTGENGEWLWNPECSIDPRRCEVVTKDAGLISLCRRRAIDYPALSIFIRKSLGERDWGRFIERYGIPPVDVTMAANATPEQRSDYLDTAEKARDGLPAVWPNGSTTSRAEASRGQDPFTPFIEHQEKLIVLTATGGTLTSLAQSDTGSLAGGAQMDVWEEIVARDSVVIAEAVQRTLIRTYVERRFKGKPLAVDFKISKEKEASPKEVAELAATLRNAGYTIARDELEEATGFTLEEAPQQPGFIPGSQQPTGDQPIAQTEDVAATALNGAQVAAMVDILNQAASGQIPKDSILPILEAAFPNVRREVLEKIVGPIESFSAPEAIARARRSCRIRSVHSAPCTATQLILNGIAKTILDGSMTLAEALKEAQKQLDEAKLADLAGDLQEELEKAMFSAAAQAAAPRRSKR